MGLCNARDNDDHKGAARTILNDAENDEYLMNHIVTLSQDPRGLRKAFLILSSTYLAATNTISLEESFVLRIAGEDLQCVPSNSGHDAHPIIGG